MRTLSIILLISVSLTIAQKKSPLTPEKLYSISTVSSGRVSPRGDKLLFVKTSYSIEKNKTINQLYGKDINKVSLPYKISFSDSNCSNPLWTPENNKISYLSSGKDRTQIVLIKLNTNEKIILLDFRGSIKSYSWAGKDKIYFLAEEPLNKTTSYFYDEDRKITYLWEYDIPKKQKIRLTGNDLSIREFKLPNNGGKQIAFTASVTGLPGDENKTEIYLFDITTYKTIRLTYNKIIEKHISFSPDNSSIIFISDASSRLEPYYQETLFTINLSSRGVSHLLKDFDYQVIDYQPDWRNQKIYFTANKGTTQQLFSFDITKQKITQNTNLKGVLKSFSYNQANKRFIIQFTDPQTPDEYYILFSGKWNLHRLTYSNPQLKRFLLGQYKTIFWKSNDGKDIEGILIYPPDYNPRKKYPLIVQLHGGPNTSYKLNFGFSWSDFPNYFASKNYIIFQPNYRGSTGYGNNFMRGIIGDFFTHGYQDIMSGVDFLVKNEIADEHKLGVMGYSAGGHFVNWIITQSSKFKFAISGSGASNMLSFYAQNEVPYLREIWMNSIPYESIDKWMKQSPIAFVNKVKTPTFFYCGDKDTRVPFTQTLEMYQGLKKYNVPTRFYVLTGAGHDIADIDEQLSLMNYLVEWIDKWMGENI